jgi:anti-sigma factor RsiW
MMGACPRYRENLLLDVHGELDPEAASPWRDHLRTCAACREERDRMLRLLGEMKESMHVPPLSPARSEMLVRGVQAGLSRTSEERSSAGWQLFTRPARMAPALAALCGLVLVVFFLRPGTPPAPLPVRAPLEQKALGEVPARELEILRHLELLKQLDTVQKLVHILDDADDDPQGPATAPTTQGMIRHENTGTYA